MKSTREKIIRTLLSYPGSTINELADAVGINGISIRHHLTNLEADDLVFSAEERHGVGRPRLIYSLTDKGVERFPTSYLRLAKQLLTALRENMSPTEMSSIFKSIGLHIAGDYQEELDGKPMDERIKILQKAMTREGYIIEYKIEPGAYNITSLSCPYHQVGMDYPEICEIDQQLIEAFLTSQVKIQTCILNGDDRCTFHIPKTHEDVQNE